MDTLFNRVLAAVQDEPSNLTLSVLIQVLYQSIPGESLTDEQSMARMKAMLAVLNIMRDGYAERARDNVSLGATTEDLIAIAHCGSRPVLAPAFAFALVSIIANGRRNAAAESAALSAIGAALETLERSLVPNG